jgi:hypothetical protein
VVAFAARPDTMGPMRSSLTWVLGAVGAVGLAWACGGKQLGTYTGDGGLGGSDSSTEDVVASQDVEREASTQDTASEDSPDGCGGCIDTGTEDDASQDDASEDDASEDDASEDDASEDDVTDGGFDGGSCVPGTSSISTSGGSCSVMVSETCGGTTYQASCSCPAATCSCSEMTGGSGSGTTGLHYSGCSSSCGNEMFAWTACGFPIPP